MKKNIYLFSLAAMLTAASCSYDYVPANGYVETTQENATTLVLKGYESANSGFSVFQPKGFDSPFYLKEQQFTGKAYDFIQSAEKRLDEMTMAPEDGAWLSDIAVNVNATYWVRYAAPKAFRFLKMRVVAIDKNNVTIEYVVTDQTAVRPNSNANVVDKNPSVAGLEIPHLNADYVYADHYVDYNGKKIMNLAIEWVSSLNHANWVAFTFDKETCQDNVKRTNAWAVDPKLPADMQVDDAQHKNDGFDKGQDRKSVV